MSTFDNFKTEVAKIDLTDFMQRVYGSNVLDVGTSKKMQCPVKTHIDKNPSCSIYDDREEGRCMAIYCHVCKKRMDIYSCIAEKEDLTDNGSTPKGADFYKIMQIISENTGITLPETNKKAVQESKEAEEIKKKNLEYVSMFKNNLDADEGAFAKEYLFDRGFNEQTIVNFHLGYVPKTFYMQHVGGIGGISDRISIPILSDDGKSVIATSYRRLNDINTDDPKYKHDKANPAFDKSTVLYGYSYAIQFVKKLNHVYLVEGYFDMISLYQAEIRNSMAYLGATLTDGQAEKISNICSNVTLIIDNDLAGTEGLHGSATKLLQKGLNVKVISKLPGKCKDMNDVCIYTKWDRNAITSILFNNAQDVVLFLLKEYYNIYESRMFDLRYQLEKATDNVLSNVKDPVKRKCYKDILSKRL